MLGKKLLIGSSSDTISITNTTATDITTSPSDATAGYRLDSDGKVYRIEGASTVVYEDWVVPNGNAGNYESRVTVVSGALTTGNANIWEALSIDRTWTVSETGIGTRTCTFDVEIRDAATLVVKDTAQITITATVEV